MTVLGRTCGECGKPASHWTVFGMSIGNFCDGCYRAANKRMMASAETLLRPASPKVCCRCEDVLTGHEDESGTLCRWCVTCVPVPAGDGTAAAQ